MMALGLTAIMPATTLAQTAWSRTGETLTNADTVSVVTDGIADGSVLKIQATAIRLTGTLAGKIYLKETVNGVDYVTLDSLTLTNVPRATKIFNVSSLPAAKYSLEFVTSGTVTATPFVYMLRRRQ